MSPYSSSSPLFLVLLQEPLESQHLSSTASRALESCRDGAGRPCLLPTPHTAAWASCSVCLSRAAVGPQAHAHTPALLVLQPMCQTDRQTWVAGGGRNLAPGQLCPYQLGSLGVCGQQNGPPTFPLLIRQPLLMSGCHCCSIMPPEPSAPPHLWGDPGGCLAGGAEAREEGSVSGSCWGCLLGPEAGRSVGFPPNRSSSGSFFS